MSKPPFAEEKKLRDLLTLESEEEAKDSLTEQEDLLTRAREAVKLHAIFTPPYVDL